MGYPKNIKDIVYDMLQEPTLDRFRDFLHSQTGEHNSIDFKKMTEYLAELKAKGGANV